MKITIEIDSDLLDEAKRTAAARGVTVRSLVEAGLRKELGVSRPGEPFTLKDLSYGSGGMTREFANAGWPAIRDEIYPQRDSYHFEDASVDGAGMAEEFVVCGWECHQGRDLPWTGNVSDENHDRNQ
jgi:hypothetical protein